MSRTQRARRKQYVVVFICFVLAIAPLAYTAAASSRYPCGAFGGGGGDAFPSIVKSSTHMIAGLCGPICQGIIGWVVGKVGDWLTNVPCSTVDYCNVSMPDGALGGGGGDTFNIQHK